MHTITKETMQRTLSNKTTTAGSPMKIGTEDRMKSKVALVTGASSGIGKATAERLVTAGYKVYGTSRRGVQAGAQSFEMLALDVTSNESVEAAVTELMRREGRVDLLVNNAGFSVAPAGAEESSIEQARAIFETNFFGIVRMTRAVIPHMRRQGNGRIINIGSVFGFLPMPFMALYAATKHAVEGYSESLDHELRTRGIRVLVIEPANTKTKFDANLLQPDAKLDEYREVRAALARQMESLVESGDKPSIVAETVLKAALGARPKLRYPVGRGVALSRMRRFVPAGMFDRSFRKQFQLDGHVNTPVTEQPTVNPHQESPTPQKAPKPADAVVADEVSFVKAYRWPLMVIGLLAGGLTVALMAGWSSRPAVRDPRLQSPSVEIFEAQAGSSNKRTFTGVVEARVQSDLGFRVGGKILERSVNMGQRVQKGQILMRLDSVDLNLSLAAQQANVEAARAKCTQTKADEARFATLVKSGAVSRQEYDQARAALDSAKAQLDAAEAQARVSNNSSGYAVLLADADGVIVRTLSEPGQVVAAGQTVIQLAHDGPREALINLPEGVRPDLGTAASARLYGQDQMYLARLRQLSDAADPASRTFEARYVLEGEAASAPLGSTVTITLVTEQKSGNKSVRVPVGAVYDRGSGPGVWIVDGKSEVKFRSVTIASIGQEEVVVSHGLDAGEKVVALGAHLLHEGQVINAAKADKKEEKRSYAKF
jgi:RND family efflux transporter MFP subunit